MSKQGRGSESGEATTMEVVEWRSSYGGGCTGCNAIGHEAQVTCLSRGEGAVLLAVRLVMLLTNESSIHQFLEASLYSTKGHINKK